MALSKTRQKFLSQVAAYVQAYAADYGIKVHSPIIAQAILESGWGESKLAAVYHNYFGLKCGSKWKGKSVNLKTNEEYSPGVLTQISDNFRVFDSMEEGIRGYFEFIQLSRYSNLKGITDPKTYLETIKADGYATSSAYVQNNMNLIKQLDLTQYDKERVIGVAGKTAASVVALAQSWIGKNEADGSYKAIIDIYNSYTGGFPRGTKMLYSWAWCACTWSALAIKLGYTDIMPIEISCYYLIEAAKKMGIWVEDDAHVPSPGEAVLYDWQDSGNGDNTGTPDHVGVVETVNKAAGTFTVIEGNYSNAVKRRTMNINGKYIRGFICPKYDAVGTIPAAGAGAKKSVAEIAGEVLAGKWGNGAERKSRLEAAGYNYSEVQAKVNALCSGAGKKSVLEVAKEVVAGKWGNGQDRKKRLEAAGYNYGEVQAKVNELLR